MHRTTTYYFGHHARLSHNYAQNWSRRDKEGHTETIYDEQTKLISLTVVKHNKMQTEPSLVKKQPSPKVPQRS